MTHATTRFNVVFVRGWAAGGREGALLVDSVNILRYRFFTAPHPQTTTLPVLGFVVRCSPSYTGNGKKKRSLIVLAGGAGNEKGCDDRWVEGRRDTL